MQDKTSYPLSSKDKPIPRRDWVVLPIIGLSTILVIAVFAEIMARRTFSASTTSINSCLVAEATKGVHGIPNSVCWEKISEGPLVEYKFDCAGYRTGKACEPKRPGTSRIVLIGSSTAMGQNVPAQDTLGALLPQELSRISGRQFELYNYAMSFGFPRSTSLRFDDALAAKPDLILWVLTAADIKLAEFSYAELVQKATSVPQGGGAGIKDKIKNMMRELGVGSKFASLDALRYFMQKSMSQSQFIQSYLDIPDGNEGDWDAGPGALRAELSEQWEARLKKFEGYAADITQKARTAGIPLVAVMVPNRAQAAMLSMETWPQDFDPFTLDRALRHIVENDGGTYIDILPEFRTVPRPERHYYPLDGHPDASGHALFARFVAKKLSEDVPTLKAADQSADVSEQVR